MKKNSCMRMDIVDQVILYFSKQLQLASPLEKPLIDTIEYWDEEEENEIETCLQYLDSA